MSDPLIVVGASYAGLNAALGARAAGYAGPILLVGEEGTLPYQRPPLSKGYMLGKVAESALPLRPQQTLDKANIEFLAGTRITAIDRRGRTVETAGGRRLRYHRLVLATGCRARTLPVPGVDLGGVHYLRTLDDARRLRERAHEARAPLIIGGGFIGLEVAASLATLDKPVTVVEAQDRLLARALAPAMSKFLAAVHRDAGVRIMFNTTVRQLRGNGRSVQSADLSDGSTCPADLVLVCVGAAPATELAAQASLACDDGIMVDEFARTSDPLIAAAGDCTRFPTRFAPSPVRLESVQNAQDQGTTAGATTAGMLKPYDMVPWFWSDQYDLKLQMVGLAQGHDRVVSRGTPEERRFSLFYFKCGALIAVDSINRGGDHMAGRYLIGVNAKIPPEQVADPTFDLAALVRAMRQAAG
jgi:3-phenylpropionate/trans-cinnamate dioxygenase ferredoxin reductase subunit